MGFAINYLMYLMLKIEGLNLTFYCKNKIRNYSVPNAKRVEMIGERLLFATHTTHAE